MVTNTPVGVLRAVVILPSCLDFMVVHRLLRQTSTWRDNGRNELVTEDCAWITGNSEATRRYPVADRSRRFEASLAPRHFFGMREMRIHIFF